MSRGRYAWTKLAPATGRDRPLPEGVAAIDHKGRPGHVRRGVAGEVDGQWGQLLGAAEPGHRDGGLEGRPQLGPLAEPPLVRRGKEPARGDRVDGHTARGPVGGQGAGEGEERGLGRLVA